MSFAAFRKPKAKNLRRKIEFQDEDTEVLERVTAEKLDSMSLDRGDGSDPNPQQGKASGDKGAARKSKTKGKSSKAVALSFGDEDENEGDAFTVKKTAASRRMMKAKLNRDLLPERQPEEVSPSSTSAYSTESLRALRESQRSAPPRAATAEELFSSAAAAASVVGDASSPLADNIPDAAAIHAARKLREQRRAAAVSGVSESPNFIALSNSSEGQIGKPNKIESRLVNEDDEVEGEEAFEDYEGQQITFGANAVKKEEERRHKEMEVNLLDAQEEDVVDEEVQQWEMEQMRKAAKHAPINKKKEPSPRAPKPTKIPATVPIPSVADVCSRLGSTLTSLELSNENHLKQLEQIKHELDKSTTAASALESDMTSSSGRYDYFQDLRTYIGDLAEFLDVKFPEVESLESDYHDVITGRNRLIFERREQDMDHCFSTFAIWTAPLTSEESMNTMDIDEKPRRLTESEIFDAEASVEDASRHMFDDAGDEFRSVRMIKQRFETWKAKYPKEYDEGYGALSMPGIFELFIRHELLHWKPLQKPVPLESMQWHQILMDFGIGNSADVDPNDPDTILLKRIAEKVVIPRLKAMVDAYDPFIESQTNALLSAANQCLDYVDANEEAFKGLMNAIDLRLTSVVNMVVDRYNFFITRLRPNPTSPMIDARNRWFWTTFQLFKGVLRWARFLSRTSLQGLAIDKLLSRQMIPLLRVSEEVEDQDKFEKIAECVPPSWLAEGSGRMAPSFLASFEITLKNYSQHLNNKGTDEAFHSRMTHIFGIIGSKG